MEETKQMLSLSPMEENEQTATALNENANDEEIERVLESIPGKVNVINNRILRDIPEGWNKSLIMTYFSEEFKDWNRRNGVWFAAGGTKYINNDFLSPDIAAWKVRDRPYVLKAERQPNAYKALGHEHLWRDNPAPHWILELEWKQRVNNATKGFDKIQNYFLSPNYMGARETVVEEAWLLAKEQDLDVPNKPRLPLLLKILRYLATSPVSWVLTLGIGLIVHFVFAMCVYFEVGEDWTGVLAPKPNPPTDLAIPYIAVFFRTNPAEPVYYHLQWHSVLRPPQGSFFAKAEAFNVNGLLARLRGELDEGEEGFFLF